jgi:hypothetical protein
MMRAEDLECGLILRNGIVLVRQPHSIVLDPLEADAERFVQAVCITDNIKMDRSCSLQRKLSVENNLNK